MRRGFWILWVLFVTACSSSRYAEPAMESADEGDKAFETECDKHEDCYPEHTFCVKGLCTGEPQPENLPVEGVEEKDNEPAAEAADFTIGGNPWGDDLNYLGTESAEEPPAEEPPAEEPPVEEPPTEEPPVEEPPAEELPTECVVSTEVCDSVDNDCDGETDDGVLNACGKCGDVPVEVCDGLDNDCDGKTDNGVLNSCGKCGEMLYEYCNGLDDDCDGQVDEVCACFANAEQKCTTTDFVYYELGECVYGKQKCVSGEWSECVGAVSPVAETCDGLDNDCDGETDNGVLKSDGSCIECLSDNDCEPGGGCSCTAEGNLKCVAIGICVAGDCTVQSEEMKCAFGCSDESWECAECANDSHCDDGNPCTKDWCDSGGFSTTCQHIDKCVDLGGEADVLFTCTIDADCTGSSFGNYCAGGYCFPCINASNQYIFCDDPEQVCTWQAVATANTSEDQIYLMKFECVTPVCTNASNDFTCDDGDACTDDYCNYPYGCIHTQIKNCVKCGTDADCVEETFCDWQNGGVYLKPGLCFKPFGGVDGTCEIKYFTDMAYSMEQDCAPPIECADEQDCPSGGSCVNWQCYYENGQYPIQKYTCSFYCPASTGTAVVWHGNNTDYLKAGMPLKMTASELCSWGWGKPSLKFNCWDGGGWWGNGQMAEVVCTAPNYTIKPDANLGSQGVMVLQFEEVCAY